MPGDITDQDTLLVKHRKSAGVIETSWTYSAALGPFAEVIERTLAAGQHREIPCLLGAQDDRHGLKSYQPDVGHGIVVWTRPS